MKYFKKKIIKFIRKRMVDVPISYNKFQINQKIKNLKIKNKNKFSFGKKNSDKLFYVIKIKYGGGIFSILLFVLSEIKYAQSINAIPIIDLQNVPTKYNQKDKIINTYNAWEYYFNNITNISLEEVYESQNVIFSTGSPDELMPRSWMEDKEIFEIYYKKFVKINSEFERIANTFSKKFFSNNKVLGVHFRGKGMYNTPSHPFTPTPKQMFYKVDKYLEKYKFNKIFLVTAQQNYFELFNKKYADKLLYLNSFRCNTTKAFHYENSRLNHRYKMGRDIMVEMLLLSKLDTLICSRSNVSQLASLISKNKNFKAYEIWNGVNTNKILLGLFLWDIKRILPEFLGGFRKNI